MSLEDKILSEGEDNNPTEEAYSGEDAKSGERSNVLLVVQAQFSCAEQNGDHNANL